MGWQAVEIIKVSDAKRDSEYIKTLWPRLQICAMCVNKTAVCRDLQSEEALKDIKLEDFSFSQLSKDVQDLAVTSPEYQSVAAKTQNSKPAESGELQQWEGSLRNEVLQLTLKQAGSVIPVEVPESLEVLQVAQAAVESIPRLNTEQALEEVQDRIDAMRVSYSQLTAATRKATRNLEQQLKKTVSAFQKQQKRDAKDLERQQQREDKRRKLMSELGKQAGQQGEPLVCLCCRECCWRPSRRGPGE